MELAATHRYAELGLGAAAIARLGRLGDVLQSAGFNVTAISESADIERLHFLDSLSLLELPSVRQAKRIVDVGSGAGMPALVLAIVLDAQVMAVESQRKKADFIEEAARGLGLENVSVRSVRAEEFGRGEGREGYDVAVSRALAALPVVAEYSMPLLATGGTMVAMKGAISNQELTQSEKAVAILGGDVLEVVKLEPFPGAENRWVYVCGKARPTPLGFPRRTGMPAKRPLGS